jgi:aspartate racemase
MLKRIGILGGMGPLATADLFRKIIIHTKASSDNEHIPILIDNNTEIPDRTAAILGKGASPVKEMLRSAMRLECMGADFLVIPCNTAHFFLPDIRAMVRIPIINMLGETAKHLAANGISRAALLATDGTLQSQVYDKALEAQGVSVLRPDTEGQKAVMDQIYRGVKMGNLSLDRAPLISALDRLTASGAQTFVLGCTELPILFERITGYPIVDPTDILARRAVEFAGAVVQ